jgi:hypothetical protein
MEGMISWEEGTQEKWQWLSLTLNRCVLEFIITLSSSVTDELEPKVRDRIRTSIRKDHVSPRPERIWG